MLQTSKQTYLVLGALTGFALIGLIFIVLAFMQPRFANANVLTAAVPKLATSSQMVVGPQNAVMLFATSSNCTNRKISTVGKPIMLSFTPNLMPTALIGHPQAASTTADYDNGINGCGAIFALGQDASTTITVSGFTQ